MNFIVRSTAHYILPFSTISYAAGILLSGPISFPEFFSMAGMVCAIGAAFIGRLTGRRHYLSIAVIPLFFLFGIAHANLKNCPLIDRTHIVTAVGEADTVVVGTLAAMVTQNAESSRAVIKAQYVKTSGDDGFIDCSGKILLVVKGDWPQAIVPGQTIIARAALQFPSPAPAPGAFDYRRYLARNEIYLTGLVRSPALIQPIIFPPSGMAEVFFYKIERLRTLISDYMERSLSKRNASLYKALVIGDRSSIAPEVLDTLKRSGIMHLWAISGMHLGLLAVLSYSLIYWLLRRSERLILSVNVKKAALLLTLPLLFSYALLAGFQPPAARAFVMTACVTGALCVERFHSSIAILCGAALIILLLDPLTVQSPSFQLSFMAVAAIVLVAPKMLKRVAVSDHISGKISGKIVYFAASMTILTIVAMLGTLPLLLFHFNRISVIGLASNLLIQPLICFISLPLGMLSLPFIFFDHTAAAWLLTCGAWGLDLSYAIAAFLSTPEWIQVWAPTPSPGLIAAYYISLFFITSRHRVTVAQLPAMAGFLVIALALLHPPRWLFHPDTTRVTVLNVGHGSANVIELKSGRVVLIDGGAQSAPGFDCGARIIAPYLWHRGVSRVDDIIITHDDTDHYNGIAALLKRFKPARLWLSSTNRNKEGFTRLIDLANDAGVRIITPDPGVIIADGDERITAVGSGTNSLENEDDRGLVLKLSSGTTSVLFPGDITIRRELQLVEEKVNLSAAILLSPHHGSATSNSSAFLKAVSPDWLVISSSDSKNGRFPAQQTLDTARRLTIPTITTAASGSIFITLHEAEGGYTMSFSGPLQPCWKRS